MRGCGIRYKGIRVGAGHFFQYFLYCLIFESCEYINYSNKIVLVFKAFYQNKKGRNGI